MMRGANDTTSSPWICAAITAPATMPGFGAVSASTIMIHSPRASAHPAAMAHGRPTYPPGRGGSLIRRMRVSRDVAASTSAGVSSVDAPSTTIVSTSSDPWARSPSRHAPMRSASFRAGTTTLTVVPVSPSIRGSIGGNRRRPRERRAHRTTNAAVCAANTDRSTNASIETMAA